LLLLYVLDSEGDDLFEEGVGEGFGERELDGTFALEVRGKLLIESLRPGGHGVDADVVLPGAEVDEVTAPELEGGKIIADGLGGVRRHRSDGAADFLQERTDGVGDGGKVFVYGFWFSGHGTLSLGKIRSTNIEARDQHEIRILK
jgi:hypothetical protein